MNNPITKLVKKFSDHLASLITEKDYSLHHQLLIKAVNETLEFYNKNMPNTQVFTKSESMFDFGLDDVKVSGLYLEFGVFHGSTINYIAKKIDHTIHGFDSFCGLPEFYNGISKSFHDLHGKMPKVRKNVILHKGWFSETVPEFLRNNNEKIAYIHIDCDLYSSTKTVFDNLSNRIQTGTIIHLDQFFNFPNWKAHQYKAFMEFVNENDIKFRYIGCRNHTVIVKITKVGDSL